jgi:hypothetical protein
MTSSSATETTNRISSSKEGLSEESTSVADAPPAHNLSKDDDQSSRTAIVKDDSGDILAADPDLEVDLEHGDGTELKRRPSSIIPRKNRRGLLASLVIGIPEIEDPKQYSKKTKGFIVFVIAMAAIAAPMGSLSTLYGY